jgi:hypothetical protein
MSTFFFSALPKMDKPLSLYVLGLKVVQIRPVFLRRRKRLADSLFVLLFIAASFGLL